MPLYVTVLEGDSAETAVPVLATQDPEAIEALIKALLGRFAPGITRPPRLLDLGRKGKPAGPGTGR